MSSDPRYRVIAVPTLKPAVVSAKVVHYALCAVVLLVAGLLWLSAAALVTPVGEERPLRGFASPVEVDAAGTTTWVLLAVEIDRDVLADYIGPLSGISDGLRDRFSDHGEMVSVTPGSAFDGVAETAWVAAARAAELDVSFLEVVNVISSDNDTILVGDRIVGVDERADGLIEVTLVRGVGGHTVHVAPEALETIDVSSELHVTGPHQRPGMTVPATASGNSAGLVFALAFYGHINPSFGGGRTIAASGAINSDGQIGVVEGIDLKVAAAVASGADVVIVPAGNELAARVAAAGRVEVVGVESLQDAIDFLQ